MKKLLVLLGALLLFAGCDVHVRNGGGYNAPLDIEPEFYSGCAVPGMGYQGDNGRYYPNGWTYRCEGRLFRSGMPYHGSILGNMMVGAYFLGGGPGYGYYGRTHNTFIINKNVTVIKKGSAGYKSKVKRNNKIAKQRKSKGFSTRKAKLQKKNQARKSKALAKHKKQKAIKAKATAARRKKSALTRRAKSKRSRSISKPRRSKSFSRSFRSSGRRSDLRFKKDVHFLVNPLSKVQQLAGVSYNWRTAQFPNLDFESGRDIGLIAQEVRKVVPEVVSMHKDGYYRVSYDKLVPMLIEAIKDQQAQIDSLREMIQE